MSLLHIRLMSIQAQLLDDMKSAMRAKDQIALATLRALKAAILNEQKAGVDVVLTDEDVMKLIRKQIKQRVDSEEQFQKAGRVELAEKEAAEIKVLEGYLPQALSAEEVDTIVTDAIQETGASSKADMGKVMGVAQKKAAGRTDGKLLSSAVMKALANLSV